MVAAALRAIDSGRDVVLAREDRASTTLFKVFDPREPDTLFYMITTAVLLS